MSNVKIFSFEKDGTCSIYTPNTPRSWMNYLWSEQGYCAQINQVGMGRSYYMDEKANMCQVNDDSARIIYLRDDFTGEFWCPTGGPGTQALDDFVCRHSLVKSEIRSRKNDIEFGCSYHVPYSGYHEVWHIEVKNLSQENRELSLFSLSSFSLEGFKYPRYYEMYRCAETSFRAEINGIYCASRHPFAPHKRYNAFLASTEPVYAYDGNLAPFLGAQNTVTRPDCSVAGQYASPYVVATNINCTNSTTTNFMLGAVLQNKLMLAPGESKEITIVLGVVENITEALDIMKSYRAKDAVSRLEEENLKKWKQKYDRLTVSLPDERLGTIYAHWLNKQVDFCIVGKKGVRDNLQIAVALLSYRPELAKAEILEVLSHQFKDGHAVLTWYPYDDTRYSDQPFWIVWSVCELIKETGDLSILDLTVPYQDGGEGTVLEHLERGIDRLLSDLGPNGMTRIFFADWNDALNVQTDEMAESVMLTEQLALALLMMQELYMKTGEIRKAEKCLRQYERIRETLNEKAWAGEWYIRATCHDRPIGSSKSDGSKIYLNAQTWAVLAGIPDEDKLDKVIKSIDGMEHDFGFPINTPPYMEYNKDTGRMSGMFPGLYENGGVYCHATGFKIMMDCKLGRGDIALRTLQKIAPDSEKNPSERSGAEPYVFTNCYSTHPAYYGKSYQSWTTGTSAWCLMALYEGLLGIQRTYEGLRIRPAFPSVWKTASARRIFRGCTYVINYTNPKGIESRKVRITFDGKLLDGDLLPVMADDKEHYVEVER